MDDGSEEFTKNKKYKFIEKHRNGFSFINNSGNRV
jgi:hypothetical protein